MGKKRADAKKTEKAAVLAVADGPTCKEALRREGGIDRAVTCATCAVVGAFECGEGVRYLKTGAILKIDTSNRFAVVPSWVSR